MQKPTCPKCDGKNTYLDIPRFSPENCYLGCYSCGWRLYGEEHIEAFVIQYNEDLKAAKEEERQAEIEKRRLEAEAASQAKLERQRELKRERDRRYRENKRLRERQEAAKRAEQNKVHIIPSLGIRFAVGDVDEVLGLPWAQPVPNKDGQSLDPCAWPPCENRARPNSKYCSRKCTVRVAHRRDKLRKKGQLKERIAS